MMISVLISTSDSRVGWLTSIVVGNEHHKTFPVSIDLSTQSLPITNPGDSSFGSIISILCRELQIISVSCDLLSRTASAETALSPNVSTNSLKALSFMENPPGAVEREGEGA